MRVSRGSVVKRAFEVLLFVASRHHVTVEDLAKHLGISIVTSREYLYALAEVAPVEIETQRYSHEHDRYLPSGKATFRFSAEWRRQHGFLTKLST